MNGQAIQGEEPPRSDADFLRALEDCTLPPGEFTHHAHVRAGYLYLQQGDFAAALARVRRAIRNFANHHGQPGRYHETITVAYLALIQQHLCERGDRGGWPAFAADNPELFQPDLIGQFYTREQLASSTARRVFLLPRATGTLAARA